MSLYHAIRLGACTIGSLYGWEHQSACVAHLNTWEHQTLRQASATCSATSVIGCSQNSYDEIGKELFFFLLLLLLLVAPAGAGATAATMGAYTMAAQTMGGYTMGAYTM